MLFERTYGIDLGSSAVKMYSSSGNRTIQTKNMIAARGRQIIAVGDDAYEMLEKQPQNIDVMSPMAFGVIAELELQEIVLYSILKSQDRRFTRGSSFYFSVPCDLTAIEKRAFYKAVNGHWLHQNRVFMVEEPIACALALGIPLESNFGSMIVNIGHSCTSFSVIADGKVIMNRRISIGGRHMDEAICSEVKKRYQISIGTKTGKRLKLVMGRLSDQTKDARKVVGIDTITGLPREEAVSSYVVNAGIMNCVNEIASEMKTFLERIPPQIAYHVAKDGIHLAGGSARLAYLDAYLGSCTGYSFNLSEHYENTALSGLEKIITEKEMKKWAQPVTERKL